MSAAARDLGFLLITALLARLSLIFLLATYRGEAASYEHAAIAVEIAEGRGFRFAFYTDGPEPSSHQAPMVALLLGLSYRLFGVKTPAAHLALELLNAALGVLAVAALHGVARQMWNRRVAFWCGLGASLYPPLAYLATRIQSINWSIPWLFVSLGAILSAERTGTPRRAALAGAAAGIGILGDPIIAAPFGLATAFLLMKSLRSVLPPRPGRGGDRRAGPAMVAVTAAAAALLVILPWTARNFAVQGRLIPVKDSFWYVFWQGNHLGASGTDKVEPDPAARERVAAVPGILGLEGGLERARESASSVDAHLSAEDVREIRSRRGEAGKMDWFREKSLETLAAAPGHYLSMCLRRLRINLWFDPTNPRSFALPYRLPYLLLAALAVAGTFLSIRRPPASAGLPALYFLGLFLVFTLVITSARFRLILEAFLLLPAGLAASVVAEGMGGAGLRCRGRGVS